MKPERATGPGETIRCPITNVGTCRFVDQLATSAFPERSVFYAFDSARSCTDNQQNLCQAIRGKVELAVRESGFEFYAFDQDNSAGAIDWLCQNLCLRIRNAAIVIADISCYENKTHPRYTSNPNVAFELGMAWGFSKPLLLISGTGIEAVPADFRPLQLFLYPDDFTSHRFNRCLQSLIASSGATPPFQLVTSKSPYNTIIRDAEKLRNCDWLLAADYHSFLYRPLSGLKRLALTTGADPADIVRRQSISELRWNNFRQLLEDAADCRFFEIYEWDAVAEYFRTGYERRKTNPNPLLVTREELIEEVSEAKRLLEKYHPRLQIAFTNHSLPYAFLVRPGQCLIIDSKSDIPETINAITVSSRVIVDQFVGAFWDQWREIPNEAKQLRSVLSRYDELLRLAKEGNGL